MERYYGLEELRPDPGAVVTVGTFDGVHVGHQALLAYVRERATAQAGRSVAVSFDPHPREVVHGEPVPLLTTVDERAEAFEALGLDRFVVLPFTKDFAALSPEAFVRDVLVKHVGLREIVIGYDHGFGRGRSGDAELLEQLGAELGFATDIVPPQLVARHVVSSSEVRRLLTEAGDAERAAEMLGRPYALTGRVVEGDRRGRTIGYPTANLAVDHPRKVVPCEGVYAVGVRLPDGARRGGMLNIGRRPTFGGEERRIEVHLFDFRGDLYGQPLRVEFVARIRDERRFESVEALTEQLSRDAARCKARLEIVS